VIFLAFRFPQVSSLDLHCMESKAKESRKLKSSTKEKFETCLMELKIDFQKQGTLKIDEIK